MKEQNLTPMEKLATFIVDKRNLFFLLYIFALVFCFFSTGWVNVENDITTYLPEETETRKGLTIMNEEFVTYGSARVMVSNISFAHGEMLKEKIEMAKKMIEETNRIHATGMGLDKASEYTGKTQVINPEYPLNSLEGGLPYPVKNGSFEINISTPTGKTDDEGNDIYDTRKITIQVSESDTLKTVLEKINQQGGNYVSASLNIDNTVTIKAAAGSYIAFGEDTTDFLMATGMNSFFSGSSAKDINIDASIKENPRLIAASEFGAEGDNTNALKISKLQTTSFSTVKGNVTFSAFYGYFIGEMSSAKSQSDTFKATTEMAYKELNTQLMSIRGVSEGDEQINLSLYQKMFEINSRYINVVDEMLNTLINGLGSAGR